MSSGQYTPRGYSRDVYYADEDDIDAELEAQIEELKQQLRELAPNVARAVGALVAPKVFVFACMALGLQFHLNRSVNQEVWEMPRGSWNALVNALTFRSNQQ